LNSNFALVLKNSSNIFKVLLLAVFILSANNLRSQFTVGGSASNQGAGCYQLTTTSNSQAGYVYQNAPINLNEAFDYRFSVFLGSNNGGADGIVFVLRGSLGNPYIGTGGGAIGFNGTGFTNSVGVEVDTWYNGNFGDIAADHIGILKNGTVNHTSANSLAGPIQASTSNANVEDGNYHSLNIKWDPQLKELEVYLDCDYRLQHQGDLIDSIFQGDSLVHWGFLGTTGGANNVQGFCFTVPIDSLVTSLNDATICAGDSVQLNAGDSLCNYSWTPTSGLSSSSIPNPMASPSTTQTYEVEISYQCDTIYDEATVTILQPSFTIIESITEPMCKNDCNGSIDISIAGGSGGYTYLWSDGSTSQDVSGLCAGNYTVTVTDVVQASNTYLCTLSDSWTIGEPDLLEVITTNLGSTSCPGGQTCDGEGLATATGGTQPYSFLWSSGEVLDQSIGLCADSNWVTVTDDNGCNADTHGIVGVPDTIQTSAFGDTTICITNTAALVAASLGGTSPYSYVWTRDSLEGSVISTSVSTGVSPDVDKLFFVHSTDQNGCIGDTSMVTINVRDPLIVKFNNLDTICPYDVNDIIATGFGGDSLYSFAWSSGQFGSQITVGPNTPKWFTVTISDFCGTPPYIDSVFQQVGGYSPIRAEIRVEDDSLCPGESIYLIARGYGGFGGSNKYRFSWGHTPDSNRYQFDTPLVTADYIVTISDLCLSPIGYDTIRVYVGDAAYPQLSVFPAKACEENLVSIALSETQKGYKYSWSMGDGQIYGMVGQDSVLNHKYSEVGCFDISAEFLTAFDCQAEINFPCAVQVLEQPEASFTNIPDNPSNVSPFIQFQNTTVGAETWTWYLDNRIEENIEILDHEFSDIQGVYNVELVATSQDGCTDTAQKTLHFIEETTIYWPSSFSPNNDGVNDVFKIEGEFISLKDFELLIYDRWGQQVFGSTNPTAVWDGKHPNGYSTHVAGIYAIQLRYRNHLGELVVIFDEVTISKAGNKVGLR
jgi:gliding motility-associated-like protein